MDWNQIEAKWDEMTRRVQSQPARIADRPGKAETAGPAPGRAPRQPETAPPAPAPTAE